MKEFDYSILCCPVTRESLELISGPAVSEIISRYDMNSLPGTGITEGFRNKSHTYFYPVFNDIILLLPVYALFTGTGRDMRARMVFDKERVFNYYNQISFNSKNELAIYEDSAKWVDFRAVTKDYIRNSFTRAGKYLNTGGKYLLDIASGPIGLKEYMDLSDKFEIRICADISFNALLQAKHNYRNREGIFICADITNIPVKDNVCDSVLCQHTLYHIPKNEQKTAVNELYRVTKPGSAAVIIYSLFYHSWFMNLALFPVQLYRIFRHFAGKFYVRLFRKKPRLYFYPHSIRWFRKNFSFSDNMSFFCWRSTNKYFLNLYIHRWLGGKKLLQCLQKSEEKHPLFWGKIGEYPAIVIKKK